MLEDMRALAADLGIGDRVEFAGWRYDDDIRSILSSADVCLAPDPPSPLNDISTMIKIPEYMAMGKPIVSYGLAESRVSAEDAAAYADGDDAGRPRAAAWTSCSTTPSGARAWASYGRERVVSALGWEHSEAALLAAYERALEGAAPAPARKAGPRHAVDSVT